MRLLSFVAVIIVVAFIGLWISSQYDGQKSRLEQVVEQSEYQLRKAKLLESKADEFDTEMERLRKQISSLRILIPEALNVVEFLNELESHCSKHNVRVLSYYYHELPSEYFNTARITISLSGEATSLETLTSDNVPIKRLVKWEERLSKGDNRDVVAMIYAFPREMRGNDEDVCAGVNKETKVWSVFTAFSTLQQRAVDLCKEVQEHQDSVRKMEELDSLRMEVAELMHAVELTRKY